MTSIYEEFEETVREKGERVDIKIFGPRGEKSIWIVGNWLIAIDEEPTAEDSRIVSIYR